MACACILHHHAHCPCRDVMHACATLAPGGRYLAAGGPHTWPLTCLQAAQQAQAQLATSQQEVQLLRAQLQQLQAAATSAAAATVRAAQRAASTERPARESAGLLAKDLITCTDIRLGLPARVGRSGSAGSGSRPGSADIFASVLRTNSDAEQVGQPAAWHPGLPMCACLLALVPGASISTHAKHAHAAASREMPTNILQGCIHADARCFHTDMPTPATMLPHSCCPSPSRGTPPSQPAPQQARAQVLPAACA